MAKNHQSKGIRSSTCDMNDVLHFHRWSLLLSFALLVTAVVLCLLCVLSGVRPGFLIDYHTIRVSRTSTSAELSKKTSAEDHLDYRFP